MNLGRAGRYRYNGFSGPVRGGRRDGVFEGSMHILQLRVFEPRGAPRLPLHSSLTRTSKAKLHGLAVCDSWYYGALYTSGSLLFASISRHYTLSLNPSDHGHELCGRHCILLVRNVCRGGIRTSSSAFFPHVSLQVTPFMLRNSFITSFRAIRCSHSASLCIPIFHEDPDSGGKRRRSNQRKSR